METQEKLLIFEEIEMFSSEKKHEDNQFIVQEKKQKRNRLIEKWIHDYLKKNGKTSVKQIKKDAISSGVAEDTYLGWERFVRIAQRANFISGEYGYWSL